MTIHWPNNNNQEASLFEKLLIFEVVKLTKKPNRQKSGGNLLLLCFFFNAYNFAPLVVTAVRADGVRQTHLTAIAALHQVSCNQCVL